MEVHQSAHAEKDDGAHHVSNKVSKLWMKIPLPEPLHLLCVREWVIRTSVTYQDQLGQGNHDDANHKEHIDGLNLRGESEGQNDCDLDYDEVVVQQHTPGRHPTSGRRT